MAPVVTRVHRMTCVHSANGVLRVRSYIVEENTTCPLFAIAQSVCGQCLDKPFTPQSKCIYCGTRCDTCKAVKNVSESCTDCGVREVQFSGIDTATELGRWLFSEEHANATIFAHNMRSFDGIFLLDYMLKQSMRPSKIIYNGSKIMYMEVQRGLNIRILDSLNFLPMKLGALPQAFDLEQFKGLLPPSIQYRRKPGL